MTIINLYSTIIEQTKDLQAVFHEQITIWAGRQYDNKKTGRNQIYNPISKDAFIAVQIQAADVYYGNAIQKLIDDLSKKGFPASKIIEIKSGRGSYAEFTTAFHHESGIIKAFAKVSSGNEGKPTFKYK